jgi:hypothetical protein
MSVPGIICSRERVWSECLAPDGSIAESGQDR